MRHSAAVTLVEMLVVMAVVILILALGGPVLRSTLGARSVSNSVDEINGYLTNARIQAMTQNTYVVVGFMQAAGSDNLQMAAVRTTSGTFNTANFPSSTPSPTSGPSATDYANYRALGPIVHLPNVTLTPYAGLVQGLRDKLTNDTTGAALLLDGGAGNINVYRL